MNNYWLELAGAAAALLLLAPAVTAPLPSSQAIQPAAQAIADDTDWTDCLACHPSQSSNLPSLSELRPEGLGSILKVSCTTCHTQAELKQFPAEWTHPVRPVGAHVGCLSCHSAAAHNAEEPLATPAGDYNAKGCLSCHPDVKLDFGASLGHDDYASVSCRECHPPHTPLRAALPSTLLPIGSVTIWQDSYDWHESNALCLSCHFPGDLFFFTEQGGFVTLNTVNYHELHVMDGQILCIECHNPHGGSRDAFIRNRLITGEVFSFYNNINGGTCNVNCHNIDHDSWQYINQVY